MIQSRYSCDQSDENRLVVDACCAAFSRQERPADQKPKLPGKSERLGKKEAAGPWIDGKGRKFHLKVEARQRLDDSECRTRYLERLRTRDQQQKEEEEEEGKEEVVEVDGPRFLIRIRMVKERQEPGADMDGVNDN